MTFKQLMALLVLGALWGGSYLLIRVAVPAFGPIGLMAARVSIAAVLLWVGFRITGRRADGLAANWKRILVIGATNSAIPFTLIAMAEVHVSASLAAVVGATVPLFGVLVGALWLRQPVGARRAAGLVLGVAGVAMLVGWGPGALTRDTMVSLGALLLSSASYGFSGVFAKHKLSHIPSASIALGQQLGAAAWLIIPALFNPPALPIAVNALWAVAALAALCTSLAFLIFFYLVSEVGAVRAQTVTYLIPVFGMAWGAIFLNEPITGGMVAGFSVILASVLLVNGVTLSVAGFRATRTP
ncbi:MAG: DMT family transporter [bacterium]